MKPVQIKPDNKLVESRYKRIKVQKEGGFGKAFQCECLSDRSLCVIKEMKTQSQSEREVNEMKKEAEILKVLKHPNVIRFRDFFMNSRKKFCIVMDYADKGDLASKLDKSENFFSENQIMDWFVQTSLALKHIHDRKIVHRDLKSQNVFLNGNNQIKLGDFGISKILKNTHQLLSSFVGTWYYISPEIIRGKLYNFKTDIWSLGVILYEMCALKLPFRGKDQFVLQRKIKEGSYQAIPPRYSPELRQLVDACQNIDQHKRPSISQVLNMPIVKRRINNFLNELDYNNEFCHTVIHGQNVLKDNDKNAIDKLKSKVGGSGNLLEVPGVKNDNKEKEKEKGSGQAVFQNRLALLGNNKKILNDDKNKIIVDIPGNKNLRDINKEKEENLRKEKEEKERLRLKELERKKERDRALKKQDEDREKERQRQKDHLLRQDAKDKAVPIFNKVEITDNDKDLLQKELDQLKLQKNPSGNPDVMAIINDMNLHKQIKEPSKEDQVQGKPVMMKKPSREENHQINLGKRGSKEDNYLALMKKPSKENDNKQLRDGINQKFEKLGLGPVKEEVVVKVGGNCDNEKKNVNYLNNKQKPLTDRDRKCGVKAKIDPQNPLAKFIPNKHQPNPEKPEDKAGVGQGLPAGKKKKEEKLMSTKQINCGINICQKDLEAQDGKLADLKVKNAEERQKMKNDIRKKRDQLKKNQKGSGEGVFFGNNGNCELIMHRNMSDNIINYIDNKNKDNQEKGVNNSNNKNHKKAGSEKIINIKANIPVEKDAKKSKSRELFDDKKNLVVDLVHEEIPSVIIEESFKNEEDKHDEELEKNLEGTAEKGKKVDDLWMISKKYEQQMTIQANNDYNDMLVEMKSAQQIEPKDYSENSKDDDDDENRSFDSDNSDKPRNKDFGDSHKKNLKNQPCVGQFGLVDNILNEVDEDEEETPVLRLQKKGKEQNNAMNLLGNLEIGGDFKKKENIKKVICYKDLIGDLLGFNERSFGVFVEESQNRVEKTLGEGRLGMKREFNEFNKENIGLEEYLIGISCI